MSLRISFELSKEDLQHLATLMEQSMEKAASASPEAILAGAHEVLSASASVSMPEFMRERQQKLQTLVDMVEDKAWNLPPGERLRVVSALAYFVLADDLIPDHIPGLGFLDDAIMIELVVRELKHELDAYLDFCQFRSQQEAEQDNPGVSRSSWLAKKREALMGRMDKRRKAGGLGWLKLR
jgi:uncharacterized membrane protein YkvA (DUF1232 family)